jgi:hypothetical protein
MKKIFLIAALLINTSTALFAQEKDDKDWTLDPKTSTLIPNYLGKIKVLNGKAIIGDRELKKGSKVYNNDLIQTSESSFVVMEMIDLTTVTIGPNSDFKVANWAYKTKNDRNAEFTVLKGQWRALVRSKSKEVDQLKIRTPVVSMGIRGTELMVNVIKDNTKEITQVALLEGSVHMETTDGKKQDLVPGDHAIVVNDGKEFQHNDKKMNAEEMKKFQEFTSPGVLRLLPPEKLVSSNDVKNGSQPAVPDQSLSVGTLTAAQIQAKAKEKEKTVQENLKILNTVREENSKKK